MTFRSLVARLETYIAVHSCAVQAGVAPRAAVATASVAKARMREEGHMVGARMLQTGGPGPFAPESCVSAGGGADPLVMPKASFMATPLPARARASSERCVSTGRACVYVNPCALAMVCARS